MDALPRLRTVFLLVRKILCLLGANSIEVALLQQKKIEEIESSDDVICWPFIVTELPGACSNNTKDIGNFTSSETCLKHCQDMEPEKKVQGCQYNRVSTQCSYFTCPKARADNNEDVTCWNFNKEQIFGHQTEGCCDEGTGTAQGYDGNTVSTKGEDGNTGTTKGQDGNTGTTQGEDGNTGTTNGL